MKKFYNELEIEVIQISREDICTLSPFDNDPVQDDIWYTDWRK